jgi:Ca2+:H+ antiporter
MTKIFFFFLIFVPITGFAAFFHAGPAALFFLSAIAIVPLAKYIGQATEELAARTSTAWGGLLNVTFGNATELIISAFALRAGLIEVVKASLAGSIIGNLLLVLGTAIFVGGFHHKKQEFNRTGALAAGSTLFLAVTALILPALLATAAPGSGSSAVETMSQLTAICMIVMYGASLLFSLHTHKHLYAEEGRAVEKAEGIWSTGKSIAVLLFATLAVAWMSDILVGAIDPIARSFGWTELFIGVVFVAIIGNAAEHASAITMAIKNKMDLALQIAIGSATQIAMFVAPVLVFVSLLFQNQMTLVFNIFELMSVLLSVVIVNLVIQDGETNWLEGMQLLIAYVIMAVAFFLHP